MMNTNQDRALMMAATSTFTSTTICTCMDNSIWVQSQQRCATANEGWPCFGSNWRCKRRFFVREHDSDLRHWLPNGVRARAPGKTQGAGSVIRVTDYPFPWIPEFHRKKPNVKYTP